jgi:hypothetical protein
LWIWVQATLSDLNASPFGDSGEDLFVRDDPEVHGRAPITAVDRVRQVADCTSW